MVQRIRKFPAAAKTRVEEIGGHSGSGNHERVPIVYRVTYSEDGKPQIVYVQLILHRMRDPATGDIAWWVVPFEAVLHDPQEVESQDRLT